MPNVVSRVVSLGLAVAFAAILPVASARADLVGLYAFDDAANLGRDTSGHGNDLIGVGTVAAGVGFTGGGLSLTGAGYLTTTSGEVPSLFPVGASSYTISVDVRSATGDYSGAIIGWGNYGTNSSYDQVNALRTSNETGSSALWGFHDYWWANDLNAEPLAVGDTGWHRVVATYDAVAGVRQLYIDGALAAQDSPGAPNVQSIDFAIGTANVFTQDFSGILDNVAVYNTSLADVLAAADVDEPGRFGLLLMASGACVLANRRVRRPGGFSLPS